MPGGLKCNARAHMDCPNKCGEMVQLEKPAWVLLGPDILDYLPENVKKEIAVARLIMAVCPKCGFYLERELNMAEWEQFIKETQK